MTPMKALANGIGCELRRHITMHQTQAMTVGTAKKTKKKLRTLRISSTPTPLRKNLMV